MKNKLFIIASILLTMSHITFAITANPIISRGKTVNTSSGTGSYLVDNIFSGSSFSVSNGSWIAINLGVGPSKVFISWNNPNYTWSDVIASTNSCKQNISCPVNYTIQKSANSTNGSDGTWTTVATITGNTVTARGHLIDFSGAGWIKMSISSGAGSINEVEVFDMSNNGTDLWFFPGTSISANTFKATPPAQDFADLITQAHPGFNPVMIRGGIPCIKSSDLASDISKYLEMAGNVKYWAIEMGTNDAWGGSNYNAASFKTNLQTVITACKNAGIEPIIARVLGTNQTAATWQVHPDFLAAVDDLTSQNSLIAGPDLYTYFTTNTNELASDGVHPNATGAASIQRLWAQKMSALYNTTSIRSTPLSANQVSIFPNPSYGNFTIEGINNGIIEIFDINGKLVLKKILDKNPTLINTGFKPGLYILQIKNQTKVITKKIVIE